MYGNSLQELVKPLDTMQRLYPWEHGKQTYFHLDSLISLRDLTDAEIEKLRGYK